MSLRRKVGRILFWKIDLLIFKRHPNGDSKSKIYRKIFLNKYFQTSNPARKLEDEIRKQIFESRSKQCWLDLILQTYKCFKLSQVGEKNPAQKSDKISHSRQKLNSNLYSTEKESVKIISKKAQIHKDRHYREGILLAWLEYNFEQEVKKGWLRHCEDIYNSNENEDEIKLKLFNNFDICLADGLVFIALTRAYCPFLIKEFFSKIYICPRTYEEVNRIRYILLSILF